MPENDRSTLRADCASCVALCCVAPAFSASSDFPVDKPAGTPCGNLLADFRCGIHDRLRPRGFVGCTVFDCFGAGQTTTAKFGGRNWRADPEIASTMFASFGVLRDLREILWYLADALDRPLAAPLHDRIGWAYQETGRLADADPESLVALDVRAHREGVGVLLGEVSDLVRAGVRHRETELRGADLVGRAMRGRDLKGANLRGALLIGADLSGSDLRSADVLGADFRGADLSGADLRTSLFLTRFQVNAANGSADTALPDVIDRPPHW
ncbi:pentapeptide repeat protein [Herbihabitans rhizosphaerae]|uniref:Pentapeptide repeat protein n=1 Tax=Herbihabitans rhizosphaerae TaxID=1872711 RepID=A0A4Q7KLR4_9PSEU|nr:pentapeptide repeat-containing protein [Herbihabitans rhizosphaerae]RZS34896.1 pentapeptide repeat protein [Herbihabitans rhizosphaerae]